MDKLDKYIQDLKESNSIAKRFASYKLGLIGDIRALNPLIEALNDHNPFVRSNVAEALGNLGNIGALMHLTEYINDIDFTVRCSVIQGISNIAKYNKHSDDNEIFNNIVPYLIDALSDQQYLIRHYATIALAEIGGDFVNKMLASVLINGSETAKEFAIWTIEKCRFSNYEEHLVDLYKETENLNIKRSVLSTFKTLGTDINIFEEMGVSQKEIEELFNDEIFGDKLYFNI